MAAGLVTAQPITTGGITFSDAGGGFTLIAASGSGSIDDPFIVVEEITGPSAAVLIIEGLTLGFGNRIGTLHPTGLALRQIIHNRPPFLWNLLVFDFQHIVCVSLESCYRLSSLPRASARDRPRAGPSPRIGSANSTSSSNPSIRSPFTAANYAPANRRSSIS